MQEMIEAIRAALAESATAEQKTCAVHACRTIATALEAQIGKPISLPGAPTPGPLAGIPAEQALDLLIARLRVVAAKKDKEAKNASTATVTATARVPAPPGLRIPLVQPSPSAATPGQRSPGHTSRPAPSTGRKKL